MAAIRKKTAPDKAMRTAPAPTGLIRRWRGEGGIPCTFYVQDNDVLAVHDVHPGLCETQAATLWTTRPMGRRIQAVVAIRRVLFTLLLVLLAGQTAQAATWAYTPLVAAANQVHTGNLGMDFDVARPISVTKVGAFNHNAVLPAGVSITVGIFNRSTQALVAGTTLTLTNANTTPIGTIASASLPSPVTLPVGSYAVVARGYGSSFNNLNASPANTLDTGPCAPIAFVGMSRWDLSASLTYPTNLDGNVAQYGAGTFEFTEVTPPGTAAGVSCAYSWLKANSGVAAGSSWTDACGRGIVATATGTSGYSPNTLNFNPTVTYNSGSGHNLPASADVSGNYTFFGVARMAGTMNRRVFSSQVGNRIFGYGGGSQDNLYDVGWLTAANPATATTAIRLYSLTRTGTTAMSYRGNGASLYSGAPGSVGTYRMSLGNGGLYSDEWSDVAVSEFISYGSPLDANSVKNIESYLAIKYGITLNRTGMSNNYFTSSGAGVFTDPTGTYWNDIAGLGRDDGSTLDQRVAKSSNSTAVLTLATGNDFTSSNGGSRTQLSNGQYLVLGSTNATTSFGSTWSGGAERMNRVWKVQNTGNVGTMHIALPNSLPSTALQLLVSTDATFATGVTAVPMTASGSFWAASASLPNGSYVSFADSTPAASGALLWLKADLGAGNPVSTWIDQSGAGNTLTAVSTSPSLVLGAAANFNFNPAVAFNGINNALWRSNSALGTNNSESSLFIVARETVRQANVFLDFLWPNPRYSAHYPWSTGTIYWDLATCCSSPQRTEATAPFAVGQASLGVLTNSLTNAKKEIIVNGSVLADSGAGVAVNGLNETRLGGNGNFYNGRISEVIVYNRYLSVAERHNLESYLALKYGLTLDRAGMGNSYFNSSGTAVFTDTGTYWNDIAGLGRDSSSSLDQRVSKSLNSNAILTLTTGNDFTNANGGSRTALTDGQYLVAGSTTGSAITFTSGWNGGTNNRMVRAWKFQNTGNVGGIYLGLPATATGGAVYIASFPATGSPVLLVESGPGITGAFAAATTTAYPLANIGNFWVPVTAGTTTPVAVTIPNGAFASYGIQNPNLTKAFNTTPGSTPVSITTGGKSDLTFTITNLAGGSAVSGIGFIDTLPVNIKVAADPAGISFTGCGTPKVAAPGGGSTITVTGAAVAAGAATCIINVKVTAGALSPTSGACADTPWANWRNGATSITGLVNVTNGVTDQCLGVTAGVPTISGKVFEDNGVGTNGIAHNGLIEGSEAGVGGVTMTLANAGGILATTQTAADGTYSFSPGTVGPLTLTATPLTGWLAISENVGTSGGVNGEVNDSKIINIPVPTTAITGLNFGQVRIPAWAPDNIKTGKANTTVIHPHTFKAFTVGSVTFGVTSPTALPNIPGWSVEFLRDANCNGQLDPGELPITGPIAVDSDNATTAPDTVCVLVRVTIPPGAATNAQHTMSVSATMSYTSPATRQATILLANDLTQIGEIAGLELLKATDKTTALPGEMLTYTLTYRNVLLDPIKTITIKDATPPYTTFVATSAVCTPPPLPANITDCAVTKQPVTNGTGALEWTLSGTLLPGGKGQVQYQVKVDQ